MTHAFQIYLIKKQPDWKLSNEPLIYFDVQVICTARFNNLNYNTVWKLLTVFPVNNFSVFLITKCFMLGV